MSGKELVVLGEAKGLSKTTPELLSLIVESNLRASRAPGFSRKGFLDRLSKMAETEVVCTVDWGGKRISVNKDGRMLGVSDESGRTYFENIAEKGLSFSADWLSPGAAPANKAIEGSELYIPCGVCLVVGAGNSGKTPLVHKLATMTTKAWGTARIGEPFAHYVNGYVDSAHSLAAGCVLYPDLIVDSIKDRLAGDGGRMKSGLSRDALLSISEWSTLGCETGTTIYIPVNPSTPDPEVMELLNEAARSNATMVIMKTQAESEWDYLIRTGEGLPRVGGKMTFTKGGVPKFAKPSNLTDQQVNHILKPLSVEVSVEAFTNATRRSLTV